MGPVAGEVGMALGRAAELAVAAAVVVEGEGAAEAEATAALGAVGP